MTLPANPNTVPRSPGLRPIATSAVAYAAVPRAADASRLISHCASGSVTWEATITTPPTKVGRISRRKSRSNGQIRRNRRTRSNRAIALNVSVAAWAIAAPRIPSASGRASASAIPMSIAKAPTYTTRSHPVRPAMIRMKPTVPTITGKIMPMIRIRSASSPCTNPGPKILSTSPGRTASTSSTGIVAAKVQRVTCL